MRTALFIFLLFLNLDVSAQLRLNVSLSSPPFNEFNNLGRSLAYSSLRNSISPGVEMDNIRAREKGITKLHYCLGFYYMNPSFSNAYIDDDGNEFLSEIKTQIISMPAMARISIPISDLIENNRYGFELGIVTNTWLKYNLHEVASIKSTDINGNIIETIYSDQGSLIRGFGSKFNFKLAGGVFFYVNRFYFSWRFDVLSLSNMYSGLKANTWQVPPPYSLYDKAAKEGRMKYAYSMMMMSFRLTKK